MNPQRSPYPEDKHEYFWDWDNDFFWSMERKKKVPCPTTEATRKEILKALKKPSLFVLPVEDEELSAESFLADPKTEYQWVYTIDGTNRPIAITLHAPNIGFMVVSHKDFPSPEDWE